MRTKILQIGDTKSNGFTLLEMVVVITIIATLSGMAVPAYLHTLPRTQVLASSHELIARLRVAHNVSKNEQRIIHTSFSQSEKSYSIDGIKHTSTANISVSKTHKMNSNTEYIISFYPDGTATPANIILSQPGYDSTIHIDWLTGRIWSYND